jgi:hypothetical protein
MTAFSSLKIVGALLPADLLGRVSAGDPQVPGTAPPTYGLERGESVRRQASRSWLYLLEVWQDFKRRVEGPGAFARLLFLVGYARHAAAWRPETVPVAEAAKLVPVVAQALWRQTERAIGQGLLPGYILVEESSQVPRQAARKRATAPASWTPAAAGDPVRRVHHRHPEEPDPADGLRADARGSARGC